jgi:hypothetical protein
MIEQSLTLGEVRRVLGVLKDATFFDIQGPDDLPVLLTSARIQTLTEGHHYSLGITVEPREPGEVSLRVQRPQGVLL